MSSNPMQIDDESDEPMPDKHPPASESKTDEEKKSPHAAASTSISSEMKMKIWKAKWQKVQWNVYIGEETTIDDIKEQLEAQTDVSKGTMKLVGFKINSKGKKNGVSGITDETKMVHLKCTKKKTFMMIGTAEADRFNDADVELASVAFILNDEDHVYAADPDELARRHKEHKLKLQKSIEHTHINLMTPLRTGKKLLVFDIDYTLFDMGSKREQNWNQLKRPFCDHMLSRCYEHYDIAIWSQTSWRWIEIKLTEMRMLERDDYKISFVLDKKAMFTVKTHFRSSKTGSVGKHYVKPLELIWSKFPQYGPHNSLLVDDLSRNFAMNPSAGLKIDAYKNFKKTKHTDKELFYLTEYFLLIAKKETWNGINHMKWKQYLARHSTTHILPKK